MPPDAPPDPHLTEGTQLATLLVSDLVASTRLVERLGDSDSAELFRRHDRLARDLLRASDGREIDKTDGFLLLFHRPWQAVRYALGYHRGLARLGRESKVELEARVGIHLGEIVLRRNSTADIARGAKPLEVEGLAKVMAARLMSVARGRQTLLTQAAFDLARRSAVSETELAATLRWLAHGGYLFKGVEEAIEVFEVGIEDSAPLEAPEGSAKVTRVLADDAILGWHPAPGLEIPQRPNWTVERKLGEGGYGEVWLAIQRKTHERRVFKFCYQAERLRSLQREITLFRLLKEELGDRQDIARILDWNFDQAPYFIEAAYTEGGSLVDWSADRGGIASVPLEHRLEIVAQVAEALAAAHSVGVLHKDVKPANVLMTTGREGRPRAVLTDFGIGLVTDRERLDSLGITVLGLTELQGAGGDDTSAGTRLYMAPECLAGKAPTIQADVYALGVMLYQLVVGDLDRPLAQGWQRRVDDELLREDIAGYVDGSPERRPRSALEVAERLRGLEARRASREAEREAAAAAVTARRRRRLVTVVAAVSTVFLVVVSALAIQALRARRDAIRAGAEAERGRAQAEALIDFMLFDLRDGLETIGRLDLLDEVARSSRDYFESTPAEDDSATAAHRRGTSLLNIGDVLFDQGDSEGALRSYRSAERHFESFLRQAPSSVELRAGLGQARSRVGEVLNSQGKTAAALEAHAGAVAAAERLTENDPHDFDRRLDLARFRYQMARVQNKSGDLEAALETCHKALALAEDLASDPAAAHWRHYLLAVDTRILQADTLGEQARIAEALASLHAAEATIRAQMTQDPRNQLWPRRLAAIGLKIGLKERARGNPAAALQAFDEARAAYRDLVASDPERMSWKASWARSQNLAAGIYQRRGELEAARELYQASLESYQDLAKRDPARWSWQESVAVAHQQIGSLQLSQGHISAALTAYGLARSIYQRLLESVADDVDLQNGLSCNHVLTGRALAQRGDVEQARREWTQAVELSERTRKKLDAWGFRDTHAQALMYLGRYSEAKPLVESLLELGWEDPELMRLARKGGLL